MSDMSEHALSASTMDTMSFHCNACGKCCNSPPAMTMPELFHHQDLFVGCLAVGKLERRRAGSRIGSGDALHALDENDAGQLAALQASLFHDPDPQHRSPYIYSLTTQAIAYESTARCPALSAEGLCSIHHHRKPEMCSIVPLDPMLPDRMQHSVLRNRSISAAYLGTQCIAAGEPDGYRPLVRARQVVDPVYAEKLATQRIALTAEKEEWGKAVFGMLKRELFDNPLQLQRIPVDGWLSLPLVPVLAALVDGNTVTRQRCAEYLDRQLLLIDRMVADALARRHAGDRATTTQLRTYADAYRRQRQIFMR